MKFARFEENVWLVMRALRWIRSVLSNRQTVGVDDLTVVEQSNYAMKAMMPTSLKAAS